VLPTALLVVAGLHAGEERIAGISVWRFGTLVMMSGVLVYALFRPRFAHRLAASE